MLKHVIFLGLFAYICLSWAEKITPEQLKCHVCKAIVQEMEDEISKVNPSQKVDVGGFRLDASGNAIGKSVPMAKSELFLTEVMEKICDKMEDYLKVTHKKTGKFMLMKIMVDGALNPESSNVDFVQDGDFNKSLQHYCLEILENQEEAFLKTFQSSSLDENLDIQICSQQSDYCEDAPLQEDYEFIDKDEL